MKRAVSQTNTVSLSVTALNSYLGCSLCGGYFRDAHTISECLHTFCKQCLHKSFSKETQTSHFCPTCNTNLGASPWSKVIFDRTLQAIVDKIFPEFAEAERQLDIQMKDENGNGEPLKKKTKMELLEQEGAESATIRVLPTSAETTPPDLQLPMLAKPLLKALLSVKISKVQKFIQKRLASQDFTIESKDIVILNGESVLEPESDLGSIAKLIAENVTPVPDPIIFTYRRKSSC